MGRPGGGTSHAAMADAILTLWYPTGPQWPSVTRWVRRSSNMAMLGGLCGGRRCVSLDEEIDDEKPLAASVVVPTHNRAELLGTCLRSLVSQDFAEPYEVIVIDDGSTDHTWSIVEQVRQQAAGKVAVRYYWQDHQGINAGRNRGAELARSGLISYVDDDIDAPPRWLAAIVAGARLYPQADVLGGPIVLRLEGRAPRNCGQEQLPETWLDRGKELVWDEDLYGANLTVRKDAFTRLGGFDTGFGSGWAHADDLEFERRLRDRGGRTLYLPGAGLWHRRTAKELGRRYLLRRAFMRGRSQAEYLLSTGDKLLSFLEILRVFRGLYHAVRWRCFYGLFRSMHAAGRFAAVRSFRRSQGGSPKPGSAASLL